MSWFVPNNKPTFSGSSAIIDLQQWKESNQAVNLEFSADELLRSLWNVYNLPTIQLYPASPSEIRANTLWDSGISKTLHYGLVTARMTVSITKDIH